jgi:hypothetical protein
MLRAGLLVVLLVVSCSPDPPQEWQAQANCSCALADAGVKVFGYRSGLFCNDESKARASCAGIPDFAAAIGCDSPPQCGECSVAQAGRCD